MRRRTKILFWAVLPILALAGIVWTAISLQRGVKSAYYEWGVTCIIASYAEEHEGSPPSKWADLVGYEYFSPYLPKPRTMDAVSNHVSVDFDLLVAFHSGRASQLDQTVVTPLQGFAVHWINPKTTLERYFRDGQRPQGSLDRESAEDYRFNMENYGRLPNDPRRQR